LWATIKRSINDEMTDARRFNSIISMLRSLTFAEELIVVVGVVSFLGGLALSIVFVKLMLFLLSGASIAYVIVRTGKRNEHTAQAEESSHSLTAEEERDNQMKKLVFDDYQASGKQYKIDFIDEPESSQPELLERESMAPEKKDSESKKSTTTVFELKEFIDAPDGSGQTEDGPRSEFNTLIQRVLGVVKDVHFAHTVALFWVNSEKQQLVLEGHLSDSAQFMKNRRLPIGSDLVSQIAVRGKPQIVNYVNALGQSDILPYYESIEAVKTFVGIPIFFSGASQDPVAVLILDCLESDAYGNETITSLAQIAKLISTLTRSYTSKYDLLLDSEVLRSINRVREQLSMEFDAHSITRSLAEEVSRLIPWDYVTVVLFDDNRKSWVVHYLLNRMNDPYVSLLSELDAQQSLAASVIQAGIPKIIDDLSSATMPRFFQAERCDSKGALMIIPLNSLSRCYGALLVESKDPKTYSDADVKLIQKLTETSSWALEILSLTDVMNNYVSLDETTGVATRKSFMGRLQEEVQRANDFSNELSLVMISIDRMDEHITRYGKDAFDFILQNVSRMVKVSIRPYDVVGRFDFNCFVVLLVHTTSNEASLWAEKIRKNVASNILNIENKSFSITISVGVAGALEEASDVDLLENADRVLRKAIEAGGNIVRVY
jgi:diguanylate cyclase (GGDEF)-like protein